MQALPLFTCQSAPYVEKSVEIWYNGSTKAQRTDFMFKYTKASLSIIVEDLKKFYRFFKYSSLAFTSIYFIYAIASGAGNLYANITLAVLFVAYTIFDLATQNKKMKKTRKAVKKSYKWAKLLVKTLTLASMIYGIYTATTNVTPMSIILATLMIILWVLQMLFAITVEVVESKVNLVLAGWRRDIEGIKRIGSIFKRDKDDEEAEIDDSAELAILQERVDHDKEDKKERKKNERIKRRKRRKSRHESEEAPHHSES